MPKPTVSRSVHHFAGNRCISRCSRKAFSLFEKHAKCELCNLNCLKDAVTLFKESKETLHYLRRNEALIRGEIPSLPTFSMTYSPRKEGVNGVNRIATKGEKYYWLPTKREKNYRLPIGKILTDYRHGRTLSIFYFTEKGASCIFPTFLGRNLRYHRLSKFNWKDKKGEKPNICCFDGRHKSFFRNIPLEGIEIVCIAYENFYKVTHLFLHITREKSLH